MVSPVIDPPPPEPDVAACARLAPDAEDARFVRRVLALLAIAALAAAIYRMADLLILAFGSVLGAVTIHAIADLYAARLRAGPKAALGGAVFTLLALIGFLVWLFAVEFAQQLNTLVAQAPMLIDALSRFLAQSPVGAKLVSATNAAYAGSRAARDLSGLVVGGGELVLNFLLLLVGALFFAANPRVYQRGALMLIPPARRPAFEDALFDVAATLRLWLRAQLIQMTTMGVLIGLGLWAAGTPWPGLMGLLRD